MTRSVPKPPRLSTGKSKIAQATTDKLVPSELSASLEEEWIRRYLAKRRGHWYQQKTFGDIQERFSTRGDFISDEFKAVIFADGAYFHDQTKARDLVKNSTVRQRGFRVFRFRYETMEYLMQAFPIWYNENFTS